MNDSTRVVLVTAPPDAAEGIAQGLVADRLVACVNVLPGARSVYRWEGAVQTDDEALLVMKTTTAAYPALEAAIRERHPYDVPEVLALPVRAGLPAYLAWVDAEVSPP